MGRIGSPPLYLSEDVRVQDLVQAECHEETLEPVLGSGFSCVSTWRTQNHGLFSLSPETSEHHFGDSGAAPHLKQACRRSSQTHCQPPDPGLLVFWLPQLGG